MLSKKIGVIGGMGPEASCEFYKRIISLCQEKHGAVQDKDYPEMIIYSLPLDGFDETGIVDEKKVLNQLVEAVKLLNNAKVSFIVMACNTIHYFIDELREISNAPIISIIEETAKKIKQDGITSALLLASETTYGYKVYDHIFKDLKISLVMPANDEKEKITDLIKHAMGGENEREAKNKVLDIIKEKSPEAVILGCTELPLIIKQKDVSVPVYDTLQVLVESSLKYYLCSSFEILNADSQV